MNTSMLATASAIDLYARRTTGFDDRVKASLGRLRDAADAHAGLVVQASSLGAEDMVITDLIEQHRLGIPVATLETGRLHAQTLELMIRIERHYDLRLERWAPAPEAVIGFVRRHGEDAMFRSVALRQACCQLRKLEPLQRLLAGRQAWVTGLRREQSAHRAEVPFEDTRPEAGDAGANRIKLNPLADWSWADVWQYIADHRVPYNPLHDAFHPSIGCQPCTRAIAVGEPFRAGRWWWEDDGQKECGLHSATPTPDAAASGRSPSAQLPHPAPAQRPA